ncbi:MAG: M24 family metallopeptidase [Planctomycetota bacterium]|jgi:Xaa-Pro aminopeptidase
MSNLGRLTEAVQSSETGSMLITASASVQWLTGFTGSFGAALILPEGSCFLTDSRYTIQAAEQVSDLPVKSFRSPQKFEDFLADVVNEAGLSRLAFDQNHVTVGTLTKWQKSMPDVEFVASADPIEKLREIKTADEVSRIRGACQLTDEALRVLLERTRPGVKEVELFWLLQDFLRPHGATLSFDPIIVSGPKTARPHGEPGEREIERGDFVTFDIGARLDGYCSDITRTVVVGPATDRQREVYDHLLKAQVASVEAMKPGASGKAVDTLARTILDEKDLAQYFGHGLGHGLGALVHDSGRLSQTVDHKIEVGQVWTIEPGVYIEGFGGIRIEDDIVITDDGNDVLTAFPKDLIELPC